MFEAICSFIAASSCFVIYIDFAGGKNHRANFHCMLTFDAKSVGHVNHIHMIISFRRRCTMQETRFRAQQGSELLSLFVTVLVLMLPCMVYAVAGVR